MFINQHIQQDKYQLLIFHKIKINNYKNKNL